MTEIVKDAALIASYTSNDNFDAWLGGVDAYESQTQTAVRRLMGQLQNIQNDPTYVGRVSDRLARVVPWSLERLEQYSRDPVRSRTRIRYQACAVTGSTTELLVSFEDPGILATCQAHQVRSNECRQRLSDEIEKRDILKGAKFTDICRAGLPGER